MQLQLDDVALFVRIVELGTLSAAARERNAPVSQVTRALARLEATCGVRLLHRSTHGLSLTDEGATFLAHGRRLLETTEDLHGELSGKTGGPAGWVRVSVSAVLAQAVIAPSLNALYKRHPRLHLDIAADDRMADMARDGIDVAIRTGSVASDTLVARQIGVLTRSLYAAPGYVQQHGLPRHPDELPRHRLIGNTVHGALNRWAWREHAKGGAKGGELAVQGDTRTDNTAVVLALAQHGAGIARIVDLVAAPLVKAGALVPVLPAHFATTPVPMFAVVLQERHRLPKIRACIEHWAHWMAQLDKPPARRKRESDADA
ncbi:MAG TPA: LysR family transcriptional regulator [Burkholderiaceae bacterium]|nr:LysR family transcriptional regulator [Burkholderiaceae bacterium]